MLQSPASLDVIGLREASPRTSKVTGCNFVTTKEVINLHGPTSVGYIRRLTCKHTIHSFTYYSSQLLNIPLLLLLLSIVCMIGLVVFAYYAMLECDPIASGRIRHPNQVRKFIYNHLKTTWRFQSNAIAKCSGHRIRTS